MDQLKVKMAKVATWIKGLFSKEGGEKLVAAVKAKCDVFADKSSDLYVGAVKRAAAAGVSIGLGFCLAPIFGGGAFALIALASLVNICIHYGFAKYKGEELDILGASLDVMFFGAFITMVTSYSALLPILIFG